jgi:hypothetical protein
LLSRYGRVTVMSEILKGRESDMPDSRQPEMTLEHALALLGLKEAPGGKDQEVFVVEGTARMAAQHGEDWIRANKRHLVASLEYIATL